jgi:ribosome-associated translation inhibitor RaiA
MQIGINSDKNITMHAKLADLIEANLHRTLDRFNSHLTRIEVHLTDENGDKAGASDKRCVLEARPKRRPSVTVTNDSTNVQTAVSGAAGKMERLLETTFGRLSAKHRGETPRIIPDGILSLPAD